MIVPFPDRNLVLTGYLGPNQPPIAQYVAERLRMRYVNVETQIEQRAGMDIESVRATFGEARLKTLENDVMQDVLLHRAAVIRVSGETLLRGDYGKRLRETGPIICLTVTLDALLRRMHLAMGGRYHNPHERALAVGQVKREWAARKLEGICELDATYLNDDAIVAAVAALWDRLATGGG